jgi:nucleoside 2-deoxyribosyltransferase
MSQGQKSFENVGIYLASPVFHEGDALSHCKSTVCKKSKLTPPLSSDHKQFHKHTVQKNIV